MPYGSEGPNGVNARCLLDASLMLLHAFIAQAMLHLISNVARFYKCESSGLDFIYLSVDKHMPNRCECKPCKEQRPCLMHAPAAPPLLRGNDWLCQSDVLHRKKKST